MNPLISVIIPVYNHAKVLPQTVASVLKQTYRPLEIIIVNDGSTDNFSEVAKGLEEVKIINQDNKGAPAARNRGLTEAKGEFVIFWDADTLAEPQMLEKMYQALINNSGAAYAYSSFYFGFKKMLSQPFSAEKLKEQNYIDVTALIWRNQAVPFDQNIKRFQDWDLWLTMLEQNKTGIFVPEILYKKIVGGRKGFRYSNWLPRFVYKLPWKIKAVKEYEVAREIVLQKHGLK